MKRILIVDDDAGIIAVLKSFLEGEDFEVLTAKDGSEAIPIVQTCSPNLIIMDIMMPKMDGGQAVRILKNDPKTESIPVLFLTGVMSNHPQGNEAAGINVDGVNYPTLAKPFDLQTLLDQINKLIS